MSWQNLGSPVLEVQQTHPCCSWHWVPCTPSTAHRTATGLGSRGLQGGGPVSWALSPCWGQGTLSHVGLEHKIGLFCCLLLLTACHRCRSAMRSISVNGGLCKMLLAHSVSNATHSRSVKIQFPGAIWGVPTCVPVSFARVCTLQLSAKIRWNPLWQLPLFFIPMQTWMCLRLVQLAPTCRQEWCDPVGTRIP